MKRLFSILVLCTLLVCLIPAPDADAAIMYTNIQGFTNTLEFSNNTGIVMTEISSVDSSAEVTVSAKLYVKATSGRWIEIDTDWAPQTFSGSTVCCSFAFDGDSGVRYKVDVTVSVTIDGYTETATDSVEKTCLT